MQNLLMLQINCSCRHNSLGSTVGDMMSPGDGLACWLCHTSCACWLSSKWAWDSPDPSAPRQVRAGGYMDTGGQPGAHVWCVVGAAGRVVCWGGIHAVLGAVIYTWCCQRYLGGNFLYLLLAYLMTRMHPVLVAVANKWMIGAQGLWHQ